MEWHTINYLVECVLFLVRAGNNLVFRGLSDYWTAENYVMLVSKNTSGNTFSDAVFSKYDKHFCVKNTKMYDLRGEAVDRSTSSVWTAP